LGLLGFWLGVIISLVHLACLKSFGIPYLFPFASGDVNGYSDMKDTIFRVPLFMMKKRPIFARPGQTTRFAGGSGEKGGTDVLSE
jgi:spore germination protein